jgi:hypothetical protein
VDGKAKISRSRPMIFFDEGGTMMACARTHIMPQGEVKSRSRWRRTHTIVDDIGISENDNSLRTEKTMRTV